MKRTKESKRQRPSFFSLLCFIALVFFFVKAGEFLRSADGAQEVKQEVDRIHSEYGVSGVPYFIFNDKYAVVCWVFVFVVSLATLASLCPFVSSVFPLHLLSSCPSLLPLASLLFLFVAFLLLPQICGVWWSGACCLPISAQQSSECEAVRVGTGVL